VSRLGRTVVCLPARGLDPLADAVRTATEGLGDPEGRPFRGHLTLARLRHRAACGAAGARFSASFTVERVHLYRSTLGPEGAVHEVVASADLEDR
jgi:2'-5' RNA ligase